MNTSPSPDDDADLIVAEYILGLLPEAEARDLADRLARDPRLRENYVAWSETLTGLTDDLEDVVPPARIWRDVEQRLFAPERAIAPAPHLFARLRDMWLTLAGGAVAAALVVLGLWMGGVLAPSGQATLLTAEIAAEDRALVVLVRLDPATGLVTLRRQAGDPPTGRAQELWLILGSAAPVSLGLLAADETRLQLPDAVLAQLDAVVLAISDEPAGGSPTGLPTGAVLAHGKLTGA